MSVSLYDLAPRLARARDQYRDWIAEQSRLDVIFADRRLQLQWLICHRELQLIRAYATGKPRYIASRQRKLARAHAELAAFHRREQKRAAG